MFKTRFHQRRVHRLHGRNKIINPIPVTDMDDFIANKNTNNLRLRVKRSYVGGNPVFSGRELNQIRNITVADADSDGNICIGKGTENVRVCIKQFNRVNNCFCFEKVGHFSRWRKVVSYCSIVNTEAGGCGGELEEAGEEEEEISGACFRHCIL